MRAVSLLTCGWPGLPKLWLRGHWSGLLPAVAFAVLLNTTIVGSFIWPELLARRLVVLCWTLVGASWCLSVVLGYRQWLALQNNAAPSHEDLFLQAQAEYLRGHWFEAEARLRQLLLGDPRDADAHLMLATLFRHTRRYEQAERQLLLLERLDGAEKWSLEIDQERQQLKRLEEEPTKQVQAEQQDATPTEEAASSRGEAARESETTRSDDCCTHEGRDTTN